MRPKGWPRSVCTAKIAVGGTGSATGNRNLLAATIFRRDCYYFPTAVTTQGKGWRNYGTKYLRRRHDFDGIIAIVGWNAEVVTSIKTTVSKASITAIPMALAMCDATVKDRVRAIALKSTNVRTRPTAPSDGSDARSSDERECADCDPDFKLHHFSLPQSLFLFK